MTERLRSRIVRIVQEGGAMTPKEIGAALGPEYGSDRKATLLRQTLGRMVKAYILNRDGGRYSVTQRGAQRAMSILDQTERQITEFLKTQGGVARTKDIHAAIWGSAVGADDRPAEYVYVTRTLKRSDLFRQDFGRGYWNLDQTSREGLPLPGRWAASAINEAWHGESPQELAVACEMHFEAVGTAFAEARGDIELETIADHPAIREHLAAMSVKTPGARGQAWASLRETVAESFDATATPYRIESAVQERKAEISRELYAMFENGDRNLHMVAPASFYRDCAVLFGVCSAALSRGHVLSVGMTGGSPESENDSTT